MNRYSCGAVLALGVAAATGGQAAAHRPERQTAAAVIAVDDAWGKAEADGVAAFVGQLLMPGYRSIGADGKMTDRDSIIQNTMRHAGSSDYRTKVAAWRRQHPSHGDVALFGDTAILTWVSDASANRGAIQSCDVFIYRDGHWRAIYSQHVGA